MYQISIKLLTLLLLMNKAELVNAMANDTGLTKNLQFYYNNMTNLLFHHLIISVFFSFQMYALNNRECYPLISDNLYLFLRFLSKQQYLHMLQ